MQGVALAEAPRARERHLRESELMDALDGDDLRPAVSMLGASKASAAAAHATR